MTMDYKISRSSRRCVACETDFAAGAEYFCAIFEGDGEFVRREYCTACWETDDVKAASCEAYSYWRTCIPEKKADDARRLEDAGAFMIVVECIPDRLGALLSRAVSVPIIGIGAGADCDGQVLVVHDILGIKSGFKPKFVKRFAEIGDEIARAASAFREEVTSGAFPGPDHVFHMKDEEYDKLV